jgi:hypothetical protein
MKTKTSLKVETIPIFGLHIPHDFRKFGIKREQTASLYRWMDRHPQAHYLYFVDRNRKLPKYIQE